MYVNTSSLRSIQQVDGGVKVSNAWRFVDAGAHALVSGSGVFKAPNRQEAIAGLRNSRRPE